MLDDDEDTTPYIDPEDHCTCDIKVLLWRGHEKNCPYLEYQEAIKVFEDWDSVIQGQTEEGVIEELDLTDDQQSIVDDFLGHYLP